MFRFLLPLWFLASVGLFLYSFTQVSLGLTLTRASFAQSIQQGFQYIGYFNRPLSTVLFIALVLLLFSLFVATLKAVRRGAVTKKILIAIIGTVVACVLLSYSAFSFDIFNYIFDAKIVTQYQDNPYAKRALDYPADPMLSFMHWTHRTYPYGPVWLGVSIPVSYLGMQYFLPTYFLFKILAGIAYIGTIFFIYKTLQKISPKNALVGAAFFGLNPLILIEFLVSGHNDSVMVFFAAWGIFLLVTRKYIFSILLVLLSIGTKYATAFLLPMIGLFAVPKRVSYEHSALIGVVAGIGAVFAAAMSSGNFQPWYLVYVLFPAAFLAHKYFITIPVILISLFACLYYVPYLYTGNWDAPIPQYLQYWMTSGAVFGIVCAGIYKLVKKQS
jgi:hypothetical protein